MRIFPVFLLTGCTFAGVLQFPPVDRPDTGFPDRPDVLERPEDEIDTGLKDTGPKDTADSNLDPPDLCTEPYGWIDPAPMLTSAEPFVFLAGGSMSIPIYDGQVDLCSFTCDRSWAQPQIIRDGLPCWEFTSAVPLPLRLDDTDGQASYLFAACVSFPVVPEYPDTATCTLVTSAVDLTLAIAIE